MPHFFLSFPLVLLNINWNSYPGCQSKVPVMKVTKTPRVVSQKSQNQTPIILQACKHKRYKCTLTDRVKRTLRASKSHMETWQSSEGGGDLTTERTLCLEKRERGDRKDGKMYDTTNPIDSVRNQDLYVACGEATFCRFSSKMTKY